MNIKTEKWNGHEIRFVWHNGEWWAVAKDVAKALGYSHTPSMVRMLRDNQKSSVHLAHRTSEKGGNPNVTIISETGIYKAIMRSKRKEAEEFEIWVYRSEERRVGKEWRRRGPARHENTIEQDRRHDST